MQGNTLTWYFFHSILLLQTTTTFLLGRSAPLHHGISAIHCSKRLPHRAQKNSAGQNSAKAAAFLAEPRPVVGKRRLAQDVVVERGAEGEGARGAGDADVGGLGGEDPEGDRQGGHRLQGEGGGRRAERGWRVETASARQPHTGQWLGWRNLGSLLLGLGRWWAAGKSFFKFTSVVLCVTRVSLFMYSWKAHGISFYRFAIVALYITKLPSAENTCVHCMMVAT